MNICSNLTLELTQFLANDEPELFLLIIIYMSLCALMRKDEILLKNIKIQNKLLKKLLKQTKDKAHKK